MQFETSVVMHAITHQLEQMLTKHLFQQHHAVPCNDSISTVRICRATVFPAVHNAISCKTHCKCKCKLSGPDGAMEYDLIDYYDLTPRMYMRAMICVET